MSKWVDGQLVADEPKPAEKTIVELLVEISGKLDRVIENTTPPEEPGD